MENNIKVYRMHRALSWSYGLLLGLGIYTSVMIIKDGELIWVIILVSVLFGLLFLAHYLVAKGAKEKKDWAKGASAVIAVIMLFGFPLGTIIGIYLLINNSGWESEAIENT